MTLSREPAPREEPTDFGEREYRSALVNVERVREVESVGHGDGLLTLVDGSRVRLSRTYRSRFDQVIEGR